MTGCFASNRLTCDEFMVFWQDKKLRTVIRRKAWLCSKCPEDMEDLRQEAWSAVCLLPPGATFMMAEKEAIRAIDRIRKKACREEKYFDKTRHETSQ
jgi:hypothetical protein